MNLKLLSCALLVCGGLVAADATTAVRPYLPYRSQSEDAALGLVGQTNLVHRSDMKSHYGCLAITPEYTRSFDSDKITQSLFGWWLQGCNKINITGSTVAERNEKDLLADWFYLDGGYKGSITFEPVIQNFNADISMYWGMDAWAKGLYFRVHAPITWTKWDLGACFKTTDEGALVNTRNGNTYTSLNNSEKFFCQKDVQLTTTNTIIHPLTSARFCGCSCDDAKTKTRLSDIQADFGWDFLSEPTYHLGAYVRGVVPTGNRPTGRYLFEPIIGNGHHWELGGGIQGSAVLWQNETKDRLINFTIDAHVTHLFDALQHRVFDLKNMPLSRYMNAFRSNEPELMPVANLTATTINSSFAAQGEIVAMFDATFGNWSADLGYNFWARSCEKIECSTWSNSCYGKGLIKNGYSLELIDASKWAVSPQSTIHTYVPPTSSDVILPSEVDYDSAETKGMSHKVFGNVGYAWMDRDVVPFVGLGGFAEFGRNEKCCCYTTSNSCSTSCCNDNCSCCTFASLSQWGLWLKGGVSF